MIFYIHIIFQPFRSFIHVIYLQNFIIHLQMDPGDQLYTWWASMLESRESRSSWRWDWEWEIYSNEIGNEGGASGLVFFGMQVELAFGAITRWCFEGQQEMLRQHFEWVWNYRPPSDLFWLAWWTWSWYAVWPQGLITIQVNILSMYKHIQGRTSFLPPLASSRVCFLNSF